MSEQARVNAEGQCLRVTGPLDFETVLRLEREGERWLREQGSADCCIDLSGVSFCNSAGTALLLSWQRTAHATGKHLSIENPPENLLAMVRLGGLESVLLK